MRLTPIALLVLALVGLPPVAAHAAAASVVKRLAVVAIQNGDTATERTQLADRRSPSTRTSRRRKGYLPSCAMRPPDAP